MYDTLITVLLVCMCVEEDKVYMGPMRAVSMATGDYLPDFTPVSSITSRTAVSPLR